MRSSRIVSLFPVLLLAILFFLLTNAALAQHNSNQSGQTPSAQQVEAKKQAERVNAQQMAALMSTAGIQVEPSTRFRPGQTYQSIRLQLTTNSTSATTSNSLAQTFSSTVNSSERRTGELPRFRSFELSSQHLLVVTVDSLNRLRWWSLIPDPRILRAEEPDAQNRLSGRVIYQPNIETILEIPDDVAASELRFYHPQRTNDRFVLTLVSAVALNKN